LIQRSLSLGGVGKLCLDSSLSYVEWFNIVPQLGVSAQGNSRTIRPEPSSCMFVLKWSIRSNGNCLGDVIPVTHIWSPVQLVLRFGHEADPCLIMETSPEYSTKFWLNKYKTKEMFGALYTS
jgi:hypothetical protein